MILFDSPMSIGGGELPYSNSKFKNQKCKFKLKIKRGLGNEVFSVTSYKPPALAGVYV